MEDRKDTVDSLKETAAILTIPGYASWYKKAEAAAEISFTGVKKRYGTQYAAFEQTPAEAWCDFFGIRWNDKNKELKATLADMREASEDEAFKKREVKEKAAKQYGIGNHEKFNQIIIEARKEGIPIRPSEVIKWYLETQKLSSLELRLKGMRKDLQKKWQPEVDRLKAELFPTRAAKAKVRVTAGSRQLWSGTSRAQQIEEEENAPTEL